MKTNLGTVSIYNRVTGRDEDAVIYQGFDAQNLAHIETRWRPMFEERRVEALRIGASASDINAEDARWEWGRKMLAAVREPFLYELFVLEVAAITQAIMLVRKGGEKCFSRHEEHPRAPLIYVDFLSTAPWNRPRMVAQPVYAGCGRALISTAISFSFEEELRGRVGLHALPGAEEFYREKIGMTDLGVDEDYSGLRYFEVSASFAAKMFTSPEGGEE
ncbi:hypothetical protein [Ensifer aridi]|uniref:hypothetical protein n=1 Tax=Ensifer aridi TaxID=1708715 RepID=UPI0003F4D949|nr:hypothetical protein [Ensifer aridi]